LASGQHLSLSAKSVRVGAHLRITVTGYRPKTDEPILMACKSQRDPIYLSEIWQGMTDAHGTLSIQIVVPPPAQVNTRPYTSCRVYAPNSKGQFSLSLPFRILPAKK
jgi:hypothetical protein